MVKLHHRLSDKAMPPKPKYTKEEIVDAAFELAREKGIDAVVAREVGKRLNTSSTPIFTVFDNMEELKNEVFQRAKNMFIQYMDDVLEYQPAFKEFGMRWVRFAKEEPNLYSFLFLNGIQHDFIFELLTEDFKALINPLIQDMIQSFRLSQTDAFDLLNQMLIHANGISSFCISGVADFTEEQISKNLSEICIGLVIRDMLEDGTFNQKTAEILVESTKRGISPRKNKK